MGTSGIRVGIQGGACGMESAWRVWRACAVMEGDERCLLLTAVRNMQTANDLQKEGDHRFVKHVNCIWNNAAFDNGEISEDLAASKQPWGSLKPNFRNPNSSFDSVPDKENQGFASENQNQFHPVSLFPRSASTTPFKPFTAVKSVQRLKMRAIADNGFKKNPVLKIDEEIEEIELQITRLNSRLEALKAEKASAGAVEKKGRFVEAKFMEQKQSGKNDEISNLGVRTKANRRGISLGQAEILSAGRRGMSLGPSEIFEAAKSSQGGELQFEPEIKEICCEIEASCDHHWFKKGCEEGRICFEHSPTKKLFRDGEKSVPNKKASRPGRVVASRYNQGASQASAMRKISLPESDGDAGKRVDKTLSFSVGKTRANEGEGRVKKRWEISSKIIVHSSVRGGGD
ncbi:uncharacterized protein LOC121809044 [Salvia splendens]|uniref:uncharacterized protein LOC121809044 n=1 Tax=Salvia splendens TaxID=180675 RepID=UPI001C2674C2|nr:uncharacterized protein LOC121809044 [Salvia splendens]